VLHLHILTSASCKNTYEQLDLVPFLPLSLQVVRQSVAWQVDTEHSMMQEQLVIRNPHGKMSETLPRHPEFTGDRTEMSCVHRLFSLQGASIPQIITQSIGPFLHDAPVWSVRMSHLYRLPSGKCIDICRSDGHQLWRAQACHCKFKDHWRSFSISVGPCKLRLTAFFPSFFWTVQSVCAFCLASSPRNWCWFNSCT
jgi:hypothetical protein